MEVRKFGKYEVIEKIGQGGMGEVFRARDPLLKRDVAIKTITPSASADDDVRKRFEREAQLAAGLNHPNIVHIYDFGEEGGKIYMAMELLLGMDLKAAMKLGTLEGMDRKLALMEDVCEGLAFAHYREIVHRDLKPANIHIQPDGRAKIMDFGLAKLESSDMTRTGVIMGTPDYMSPEQVQGGRADFRSDIYSLGAVFYELLAGRRPFQAESTHALLFQVLYNHPDAISDLVPGLPPSVRQIIECAMSKDPAQRFQNGGEMRDAVRAARAGLQAGDADATLVADVTFSQNPATPSGGFTPPGRAATPRPSSGGMYPRTPVSGAPAGGVPISGGISGYPHPLTPGPSGPGSVGSAGPGMTPGSQGYGSFSQPAVVVQKSGTGLVVGLAIAVIAVGAVALYAMGLLPGVPRESAGASQEVSQLQHDLLQRDLDSADEKLRAKDYEGALAVVERILSRDPGNAQATRMRGDIETVLKDLEARTAEAQAALDGGDPDRAAEIVSGMLQVHPGYAPALELSGKLDDQLRARAEGLRADMAAARRRAEQTRGATALGSFVQAASVAGEAQALLDSGSFSEAAGKFKAATDGFDAARQQAQQTMTAPKRARAETKTTPPPDPTMARKARDAMETSRAGAEATEGAQSLGSYVTAVGLEREGETLFGKGAYDEAREKFQAAADGFDAARGEAKRLAAVKPPPPAPQPQPAAAVPPQPVPQPAKPKAVDDKQAIREVLRKYQQVFETEDLNLYQQIKPNVSGKELEGLKRVLDGVDHYDVAIEISSIEVKGSEAVVTLLRQDTMDGKARPRITQTLYLTKSATRGWVIERLGK